MLFQIIDAQVLTPFVQKHACVVIRDGRIAEILPSPVPCLDAVDAGGQLLVPGFIDLHVHGGGGISVLTREPEDILLMYRAHAAKGTTALLPTVLSATQPQMLDALSAIREAMDLPGAGGILGAHVEGPCLSPAQRGAQPLEQLIAPADLPLTAYFERNDRIRIMGVAPEERGGLEMGDALCEAGILPSIAHSNATYDQVQEAAGHGYRDVTHLYSGCSGMVRDKGYRIPGVIEAGLEMDSLTAQVIADGSHLPHSLLRLIYRAKGPQGMYLISDALEFACSDLAPGRVYCQRNGVEALYEDGVMKLPDRSGFAGSVATMADCVRTVHAAGIPLPDAVRMATDTPARRIGATHKGRIEPGFDADLLLLDEALQVQKVWIGGEAIS